jgi:hypothetical protein
VGFVLPFTSTLINHRLGGFVLPFKYFGYDHAMKIIPETCRAH